ncbi:uncharacterized protein LOC115768737 [Drosophila novamexicana]|uniref:uncharacterized protein LOC115768737 n=1 Tax=Drosophila novamexicana TaxID=47314 RepID=UPI0011E5EED9|nr:uncharacterized protein LOC115768737 [Drosophila novamexicana]
MWNKRCVLALIASCVLWLALATREAAGETMIEVDEHGDEYELKRFHIQGRQLNGNGSKSQCVVTRRKRASGRSLALAGPSVAVSSQQLSLSAVPAGVEHREAVLQLEQEPGSKRRYVALAALQLEEDDEDDDDEEEEEDDLQVQLQEQPVAVSQQQQKQFSGQNSSPFVGATFAQAVPGGVSVVANAATHANVGGDAGIVVVESQQPPKVNPNTHAVFELKPLSPLKQTDFVYYGEDLDLDEDEDEDGGDDGFYYQGVGLYDEYEHFVTEDSPVSTSAIWSTGGDDDGDIHPVINEPNQRPVESKKKKKKQQQQVKRRKSGQKRKQQQQQQQEKEKEKKKRRKTKPTQKKKKKSRPSSSVNKRRRPSSSSSSSGSSVYSYSDAMGGYRRRRPQQSTEAQRRRRLQQKRRRQQLQRRRRRRNKIRNQNINGVGVGYRREYFGDEPIVNCIYINKDPPATTTTTTTPRPFWNLLGRGAQPQSAAAEQTLRRRSGEFGQRKRTNLKFVA